MTLSAAHATRLNGAHPAAEAASLGTELQTTQTEVAALEADSGQTRTAQTLAASGTPGGYGLVIVSATTATVTIAAPGAAGKRIRIIKSGAAGSVCLQPSGQCTIATPSAVASDSHWGQLDAQYDVADIESISTTAYVIVSKNIA